MNDIRRASLSRSTGETSVRLELSIDGEGKTSVSTGFGMLDHMLTLTAFWAGFDLQLVCTGDMHVDAHHTAEDVALCLGKAFREALDSMAVHAYNDLCTKGNPRRPSLGDIKKLFEGAW